MRVGQTAVDPLARLFQQAGRALLTLTHPVEQISGGALLALVNSLRHARHLLADVIYGLGRPPFGASDPFGQPLGDARNFSTQLLKGFGLSAVSAPQLLFYGVGDPLDLGANLIHGLGAALL